MPKLIESTNRKEFIAECAWRVILAKGIEKASARTIAKEAGLSLGSLRYYFSTQEELLMYAEALAIERMAGKIENVFMGNLEPKEKILEVLLQLLPNEGGEEPEQAVRLFFKFHNTHRSEREDDYQDGIYAALKNVMSNLVLLNLLKKEANLQLETDRLSMLIDGLAMESLLNRQLWGRDRKRKMLIYHLNSLCKEEFGELE